MRIVLVAVLAMTIDAGWSFAAGSEAVLGPSTSDLLTLGLIVFLALGLSFMCSVAEAVLHSITPA